MVKNKALEALKSLESYGYIERDIKIGDVKITLAPLTAGETIEVFEKSNNYNDIDASIQTLKIETLARSIVAVNNDRFNPKNFIEEKKQIVLSMGDELIELLFDEYCHLDKTITSNIEKKQSIINSSLENVLDHVEQNKVKV